MFSSWHGCPFWHPFSWETPVGGRSKTPWQTGRGQIQLHREPFRGSTMQATCKPRTLVSDCERSPLLMFCSLPFTSETGCQYILQKASLAWSPGNLLLSPRIQDAKLNLINSILCHSYPLCSSIGTQHRGRLLYFPKRVNSSQMSTSSWPCLSPPSGAPQDRCTLLQCGPGSNMGHVCVWRSLEQCRLRCSSSR